jgi:TatD DNase family protein
MNIINMFDTHCHLDVTEFDADRDAVLARARANGVTQMLVPAVNRAGWRYLIDYCRDNEGLYPALGMHPVYIDQHRDEDVTALAEWVEKEKPLAIGEIGLDYFVETLDRNRQQQIFEAQLCIARDANLPVVLHVRKSHDQILQTLKRIKVRGGFSHAFNGSEQHARQYAELGFKLGFGGMLTYERSNKLRHLAKVISLEDIVLETDAPDMTVAAHRGERNSPEYLPDCLRALAEVKEMDVQQVAEITTRNAMGVMGISGL